MVLNTNKELEVNFSEILTANHPTPHWWLAEQGYTGEFEQAVDAIGANGIPIWKSFIAGLDPNDSEDVVKIHIELIQNASALSVKWQTVRGRLYSILVKTNDSSEFSRLPHATDLDWTVNAVTNRIDLNHRSGKFKLEVKLTK